VERAKVVLSIGLLLGCPNDGGVKTEACRKQHMATHLTLILMAIDSQHAGRLAKVGPDEQPRRRRRFLRNAEQARIDVGRTGGNHAQSCLGPGQNMTGMVHHTVTPHCGHYFKPAGNSLGGERPGVLGRLWPSGLDLESASQYPDHRTMSPTSELGRRGIGDEEQPLHFLSRVLS
jgi:hypothetical protein